MRKLNHFWFFSKALSCAYFFVGITLSWGMLLNHYLVPASIVFVASTSFAVAHWLRLYWAFLATVAIAAVVNIFSVFYFFPFFGDGVVSGAQGGAVMNFIVLTIAVVLLGLYVYLNKDKMVGKTSA
jgi:hypothetical protein